VGNNTEKPQTILSLYSGGGGLDIGVAIGIGRPTRTVCYVERDFAAISVLENSMRQGRLDEAPLFTDSNTFDGKPFHNKVDWIIGGFPCQPFSVAGQMRTDQDERWLWDDIWRIVCEVRPRNIFLENVSGVLVHEGIGRILGDLSTIGFNAEWTTFKASDVGASHQRKRVFILAYQEGTRPSMADPYWVGRRGRPKIYEERSIETKAQGSQCGTSQTVRGGQTMDDTNTHRERQPTKQSEQNSQRENHEVVRRTGTDDPIGQSNAGGATAEPGFGRLDGRTDNKQTKPSKPQGFHNLASLYDDSGRIIEPDGTAKDNRRALVQERKRLLQLSDIDTMGDNQIGIGNPDEGGKIRQRNDDDGGEGMGQPERMEDAERLQSVQARRRNTGEQGTRTFESESDGQHDDLGDALNNEQYELSRNQHGKKKQSKLRDASQFNGDAEPGEGHERGNLGNVSSKSAFPPRPSEKLTWHRIIKERPDLAPALEKSAFESKVRGMVDGVANQLDRVNRLRILGNGVVPLQSATALRILVARIWGK